MSGTDTQSNPTSDYDFAELQQDPEEAEVDDVTLKHDLQKIDMNLMLVLNRFPLSDKVIGNFGMYQIKYSQLKSLERDDLRKLGISDDLSNEMIEEFRLLEGQDVTLKETIENFQLQHTSSSSQSKDKSIVDSLQDHLFRMNTLLAAVSFQLGATSSASSGVIINQRFCSTQVVLDLLGQLSNHTVEMEDIIKVLKDPTKFEISEQEFNKKRKQRKITFILGTIGLFVAGIFLAKRLGIRKML